MLNRFQLKVIALMSMVVDHMGVVFFPDQVWMRMVGRISMPIFVFLLVQGYRKTRDVKRYQVRLAVSAVVMLLGNWVVGDVVGVGIRSNMFLTLLVVLIFIEAADRRNVKNIFLALSLFFVALIEYGVLALVLGMVFRNFEREKMIVLYVVVSLVSGFFFKYQYMMLMSLPFILLYSGERGPAVKWFFYVFYPAHIWGLYLIKWGCFS